MQSRKARPRAMLHPLFVAGVLEGFEGTLDEVVARVEDPAFTRGSIRCAGK
jgi:hypothetical protein